MELSETFGEVVFRTCLGGNYLRNKACREHSGYYLITGKNAVIKFNLCKRFTGTVTPMFFLFLENMKVQGVKLIKCFNLYRRLNNAIFFLDYRDTFISALFITSFFTLYYNAFFWWLTYVKVVNFEKLKQGFEWQRKWIGEIFIINDNPFFFWADQF